MEPEYWIGRWRDGLTGWHRQDPNPHLLRHASELLGEGPRRVLVPLAGKTVDLCWLVEQGHEVTGIELSSQAIETFHEEQGLEAELEVVDGVRVHRTPGLRIVEGDLFQLPRDLVGEHDVLYDRAALIALRPDQRGPYVERIRSFLASGARGLVVSLDYDQSLRPGPPHSVEEREVRALWEPHGALRLVHTRSCLDDSPMYRQEGLDRADEVVWLVDLG